MHPRKVVTIKNPGGANGHPSVGNRFGANNRNRSLEQHSPGSIHGPGIESEAQENTT